MKSRTKKILFLSTLNLACNPRLYKEIMLAQHQGYDFEVICFEFNNWSREINKGLLRTINRPVHLIQGNRKPFVPWALSVFKEQVYREVARFFPLKGRHLSQAISRRSDLIIDQINRLTGPFDLVIGHNPGALFPTWYAARKFHCKSGFDVEDYHPGETRNVRASSRIKRLLAELLPKVDYKTFASQNIFIRMQSIVNAEGTVVLNRFPSTEFMPPELISGRLQIVWFSQNISFNRGLEKVLPIIGSFSDIELHLYGNCNREFHAEYLIHAKNVILHDALSQGQLHRQLRKYDCGLAIEPGKDENNKVAISNKLLAYYQAGLYVLASDTPAQKRFFEDHPHHGIAVPLQSEFVTAALQNLLDRRDEIRRNKMSRFESARSDNWEAESQKLLRIWNHVLETEEKSAAI